MTTTAEPAACRVITLRTPLTEAALDAEAAAPTPADGASRSCAECAETFTPPRPAARYGSAECQKAAGRKLRNAAGRAAGKQPGWARSPAEVAPRATAGTGTCPVCGVPHPARDCGIVTRHLDSMRLRGLSELTSATAGCCSPGWGAACPSRSWTRATTT